MATKRGVKRRVCVIGSGISGLLSIKQCLDAGLDPVCYEKSSSIGGLWRYVDNVNSNHVQGDQGSVSKSTVANSSKEISAISDFPPPDQFPIFMPHEFMVKYFELYAKEHSLEKRIQFNCEVMNIIKKRSNDSNKGDNCEWIVEVRDNKSNETSSETFHGVMVCTGHHSEPVIPKELAIGSQLFQGDIVHSKDVDKIIPKVAGKSVLIVGGGNSAGDAAVDCSNAGARSVYLHMRSGAWLITRAGLNGYPLDAYSLTRFKRAMLNALPARANKYILELLTQTFFSVNHNYYGLKPNYRIMDHQPLVNDSLGSKILSGQISVVRGNITQFTNDSVHFEMDAKSGKSKEKIDVIKKVDVIISATGYKITHPFLDWSAISGDFDEQLGETKETMFKDQDGSDLQLEKLFMKVFSPNLPPSFAWIGLVQPLGAFIPAVELQARWFTSLLAGESKLPPKKKMEKKVRKMVRKNNKVSKEEESISHKIEEHDWIHYLDTIANQIKVKPNFWKLFFTDFIMWKHLIFGASYPYQYRLSGRGKWKGAKDAILTAERRQKCGINI